jgi:broad-specificity NMP kinase
MIPLNRVITKDDYIDFDKYPKTRYEIRVDNSVVYWFVTTARSTEEAIVLLKEKAEDMYACLSRGYKIYKILKNNQELLYAKKRNAMY